MENGEKYMQKVGMKEGRVSRTQYLFFQVYNNTKKCCWSISVPRECIGLSRILLEYPYSYFLPLLSCFQCIVTIIVCHIFSASLSHLPYYKLFLPFTYFLTIHSPEKYIYMFGLLLSWVLFALSIPMLYHLLFYHLPQPLEVWVTPRYSKIGELIASRGDSVNGLDTEIGSPNGQFEESQQTSNTINRRNERCPAEEYCTEKEAVINAEYEASDLNSANLIRVKQGVFHRAIATWTLRVIFISLSLAVFFAFSALIFPFGLNLRRVIFNDAGASSGILYLLFNALLNISPSNLFVFFSFIHVLLISIYVFTYKRPVISRLSRLLKMGCSIVMVLIILTRSISTFILSHYYMNKFRSGRLFNDNYPNLNSFLADFNIKMKANHSFYVRMALASSSQYLFLFTAMVFISSYSLDIHQLHLSSINAFKSTEDSESYSLIKRGVDIVSNQDEKESILY
ncbi:transmembrane domain-containing protein [Cryptosporidium canis]|uniref:Transmembrane domain-containing protein n=1 Tax=Cryptosporidium canis TaxID=195482 RepID=A0ABQ8P2Y4_9CRYT|nr:transmembrane domain-containing protein [Cryptosporidium canis]KAJ1614220.1 transmembrane domain-containing protein [Cryptosporidium canis]